MKRRRARTRRLAMIAGAATLALAAAEAVKMRRRGHGPRLPAARHALRGGEGATRDAVNILRAGYQSGSADETAVLNLFVAFGLTFGAARAVTHSIRRGSSVFGKSTSADATSTTSSPGSR
jgi:hypothetical protein